MMCTSLATRLPTFGSQRMGIYLSETLVMSKNPFTGERTSVDLSKLGQGTHRHVYGLDPQRVIKFASHHGNEAHWCACFPRLTAQILAGGAG